MEIFKWAQNIEKVYEDLINEAINERNADINELEQEEREKLNFLVNAKEEFVTSVLKKLSEEVDESVNNFNSKFETIVKQIRNNYEMNKDKLSKIIIEKIGLNF